LFLFYRELNNCKLNDEMDSTDIFNGEREKVTAGWAARVGLCGGPGGRV